jgi:thymidylate synthase
MNNLDKQYLELLTDILENGTKKEDRTGTSTISVFGRQIRHKMSEGFPMLTTKKVPFKTMVVELLWFLRGETDIRYLWENKCFIWDGDWYKYYVNSCSTPYSLEEMKEFALNTVKHPTRSNYFHESIWSLGSIYGKLWRSWYDGIGLDVIEYNIDQIQNLINDLKTNPDSRRILVSAWNPSELENQVLPPCHYGFQVYTRELSEGERGLLLEPYGLDVLTKEGRDRLWKENNLPTRAISLMWNQRSVDVPLGLPFNIASYALLLMIIAKEVNMIPDELIGNLGDIHIYLNQIDGVKEQINRTPYPTLPSVEFSEEFNTIIDNKELTFSQKIDMFKPEHFILVDYQSHPKIYFPLSN